MKFVAVINFLADYAYLKAIKIIKCSQFTTILGFIMKLNFKGLILNFSYEVSYY